MLFLIRFAKFAVIAAVAAVLLTGAARYALKRYLTSDRGKAMVAEQLGTALGMPVEVSEVDLDGDTASFRFRVMDPRDTKTEVLGVRKASADVSVSDLASGRVAPSALTLDGASLTLRVSPDGRVLTPLPALPGAGKTFPAVEVTDGSLCVRQEGRPEFAVSGVNMRFAPNGDMVKLTGSVDDENWGQWTIRGEFRLDTRSGWLELTSTDAPLDPELLAALPFVPPEVFERANLTGRADATVRFKFGAGTDVRPVAEIRPHERPAGSPPGFRLTTTPSGYVLEPLTESR